MNEQLIVFKPNTEVKIKNARHLTAYIEKVIISNNDTIQYQLIIYTPIRDQMCVHAYEIDPVVGEKEKKVGFHISKPELKVDIFLENGKLIDYIADEGVSVTIKDKTDTVLLEESQEI